MSVVDNVLPVSMKDEAGVTHLWQSVPCMMHEMEGFRDCHVS